jgi:phage terminase large subunit
LSVLAIPTAEVFEPLLAPARYKGAWGGRGSGKSHFFAEMLIDDAIREPGETGGAGLLSVCIRQVQKSLKQSSKRLIEAKLQSLGLGEKDGFKVFKEAIQTPGDGVIAFQGMQDHTADSIKSLEGFKRAWWECSFGFALLLALKLFVDLFGGAWSDHVHRSAVSLGLPHGDIHAGGHVGDPDGAGDDASHG